MINKKKPRVCLIYTGGTIGMERDGHGTLLPPRDPDSFKRLAPELSEIADMEFVPLLNKDSTNMIPDDWTKIARCIFERRDQGFQGFVVAHGTDTMHFSSSAVAFALGANLNFPVVFTGAQTAPDVLHGDARINLIRAFQVAVSDIAEVVVSFGDYVFRGCRAQKKDERKFDAFESPSFFPLAYIMEDIIVSPLAVKRHERNGKIDLKPDFASGIIQISLIPGLEPALLNPLIMKATCRGIVLQSFGAGNVPSDAGFSLAAFINEATAANKPVLITSQFPANATLHTAYAPGKEALKAGAIPTGNMTSACATAKFRWVLAQVDAMGLANGKRMSEIRKLMQKSFVNEMDEDKDGPIPISAL